MINRKGGLTAAELAYEACFDELWEIGESIFATPANTLDGMMVKIRASDRLELEKLDGENQAFASIAADIRRMTEGGAA
ncbi:hypothetical protein [Mesorhizobium sp.]|uniref:hypothetical protein n=1 Tax=Mesorhizobium sp. TaxID=1871066 RepID=UPI000FE65D97|nr:hypothetical protein [Mesorhizobium sp.]RWD97940.1 MAG: hypothetical protein EOS40_26300 [Mesorhizobium sp.]